MGQKINPISTRLYLNRTPNNCWFSDYYYSDCLSRDLQLQRYIKLLTVQLNYSRFEPKESFQAASYALGCDLFLDEKKDKKNFLFKFPRKMKKILNPRYLRFLIRNGFLFQPRRFKTAKKTPGLRNIKYYNSTTASIFNQYLPKRAITDLFLLTPVLQDLSRPPKIPGAFWDTKKREICPSSSFEYPKKLFKTKERSRLSTKAQLPQFPLGVFNKKKINLRRRQILGDYSLPRTRTSFTSGAFNPKKRVKAA